MGEKTIVVTGGSGFIGSHLCEFLLNKGNRVICIDNLLTGSKENVKHLISNKNFHFIEQDVTENVYISEKVDRIFHLASPASPVDYAEKPLETMMVNSAGTKEMLDLAKRKNARFLLASTSEVYGDPKVHPQKETYWGNVNPIGPRACYDEAKRFSEALTMTYRRKFGVKTRIARIFNTYGPRMRKNDGRIVPNFISQALRDEHLTVYGKGRQTRSFCFVSDLIEGLNKLMNSNYDLPVNLGNPEELTVLDFAKKIIRLSGSESGIVFRELPEDDPKQRKPDISVAKKHLNWKPKVRVEEGLKKTIEWFKKH